MAELMLYNTACKALAKAVAVDEAKKIRDNSEAMRAYAKQAKNKQLEIDAAELRIRAERRIGELMQSQKDAGFLKQGGDRKSKVQNGPLKNITLEQAGIDKHLADRARKLAAVPDKEWEEELDDWRDRVSQENARVVTRLESRGESEIRRTERKECNIPDSAIGKLEFTCPKCGQRWPEGMPIHG